MCNVWGRQGSGGKKILRPLQTLSYPNCEDDDEDEEEEMCVMYMKENWRYLLKTYNLT